MSNEEFIKQEFEKVSSSNVFVSVVTNHYLADNGKCALEMGFAVLLDKPIRLLVREGTILPKNLQKIAERIEYFKAEDDIGIAGKRLLSDLKF